jgi:excisionase family DNA binding protein
MTDFERLLTTMEAASLLGVSHSWLKKQVIAAQVPCTRLGRSVRFSSDHLRAIVAAGERQPSAVVYEEAGQMRKNRVRTRL